MTRKNAYDRYEALDATLEDLIAGHLQDVTFVEVGTYNGKRAAELCRYWKDQTGGRFVYVGFDLFEDMDPDTNKAELSKSTLPPTRDQAAETLRRAGADATLIKGNTRETLPTFVQVMRTRVVPDVVFVDGGHSLETIDSDWAALQALVAAKTVVIFDDYYDNRDDYGCKKLITRLRADAAWAVELLDPADKVQSTGLRIRMVRVRRAPHPTPSRAGARAA